MNKPNDGIVQLVLGLDGEPFHQAFRIAFPPGTLSARISGEACEPGRILWPGDEVVVTGQRDTELSRLLPS